MIETQNLLLRKMEESDFPHFANYYAHPEAARWHGGYPDLSPEGVRAAFDYNLGLELCFAIVEKSRGEMIGNVHFVRIVEDYLAEVGFILDPQYWGQGLMTEALKAALDFAFNDYGLARVRAGTECANAKSINLLERCGFIWEATLQDGNFGGRVADVCIYSALNNNSDR